MSENGGQVGALLAQTYVLRNTTTAAMDFDLVRYVDVDVVDTGDDDGGGRIFLGGEEWLVTTGADSIIDFSLSDIFVAISTEGGQEPSSGRFEVDWFPELLINLEDGGSLDDTVFGDGSDADELIDSVAYDTTGALRSDYLLAPGESTAFVTYTLFADGVVEDILTDAGGVANAPPQVTDVTISGVQSNNGGSSTHAPYSFADQMNDPSVNWIAGDQLKTVPVGGADTVAIEFSEHVLNVVEDSLLLRELTTGQTLQLAANGFDYNVTTHTATWTFAAAFDADQHLLSLADTVTDTGGNQLDGEWTNPFSVTTTNSAVSEFPSGDGTAGGYFNFVFTILPGDADGDNDVDGSDFLSWASLSPSADFDGDGDVDGDDLVFWEANFDRNLRTLLFADFDGNGVVDWFDWDIADLSVDMGFGSEFAEGDVDGDGDVDIYDLNLAAMQMGLDDFVIDWVA